MVFSVHSRPMLFWALCAGGILVACSPQRDEIPITTKSAEARQLFIKARTYYENLREDEARDIFSQALEKDLDFALCHYYLADLATSSVEFQTHLKLAASLARNASEGERLQIEAFRALAENKPEKAILLSEELVQKYPRDKRAQRLLGYLYRGRDEDKAIAAYKRAIALDSNYAPAYNNLGYAYRRKGDYEQAIENFKKYIALLPDEANPYDSIADLYSKMGKPREAIAYYEKAVALNSAFSFSQSKIGENFVYLGEYEKARAAFDKAYSLDETAAGKVNAQRKHYLSYIYEGDLKTAFVASDQALKFAGDADLPEWQARIFIDRAAMALELGRYHQAEMAANACKDVVIKASLAPTTQENFLKTALLYEARIACARGRFDTAEEIARRLKSKIALGDDPLQMDMYYTLEGEINHNRGLHQQAIENFEKIKKHDPMTYFAWAVCLDKMGERQDAIPLYRRAVNWNEYGLADAIIRRKAAALLPPGTLSNYD